MVVTNICNMESAVRNAALCLEKLHHIGPHHQSKTEPPVHHRFQMSSKACGRHEQGRLVLAMDWVQG